jgi:hypothetical protein
MLQRRLGPLPVWGWVVVAIAAFLVWRRKTETGYFPISLAPTVTAAPGTIRARLVASIGGSSDEDEPSGDAPILTLSGAGRPALPSPITSGGPDGTTSGGGGGAAAATSTPELRSIAGAEPGVVPLFGRSGPVQLADATSRLRGGRGTTPPRPVKGPGGARAFLGRR